MLAPTHGRGIGSDITRFKRDDSGRGILIVVPLIAEVDSTGIVTLVVVRGVIVSIIIIQDILHKPLHSCPAKARRQKVFGLSCFSWDPNPLASTKQLRSLQH